MKRLLVAAVLMGVLLMLVPGCNRPGEAACQAITETFVRRIATDCQLATEEEVREGIRMTIFSEGARGCEDIDKVRDEDSFYNECLPALDAATCDEILSINPPSCQDQLIFLVN